MSASRPTIVAIQGEPGAYSDLAARQHFCGAVRVLPCRSFEEMFAAVRQGRAHYGMAALENSLAGSIHEVWRLLAAHSPPIAGEIYFRVRHCLVARAGARLEDLRRLYSHPQALAQCSIFIQSLGGVETEAVYDTAGAVEMIKAKGWKDAAAIASARAAAVHEMAVLAEDIQTDRDNFTRFLLIAHTAQPPPAGAPLKTTLVLELPESGRELASILAILHQHPIAVLKVESHKCLGHPWNYFFYLELEGAAEAVPLAQLRGHTRALHLVGTYPMARRP